MKAQSFAVAMLSLLPRSLHLHILNAPGTLSQGGHKVFLEMWKSLPHSVIIRGSHENYVFNCVIRYNFRWIGCFVINCRDTRCVSPPRPLPEFSISLSYKGMCQPRKMGTVGAEPFSAKLRYTGAEDPKHPNLIKVTVTMPHIDGR